MWVILYKALLYYDVWYFQLKAGEVRGKEHKSLALLVHWLVTATLIVINIRK